MHSGRGHHRRSRATRRSWQSGCSSGGARRNRASPGRVGSADHGRDSPRRRGSPGAGPRSRSLGGNCRTSGGRLRAVSRIPLRNSGLTHTALVACGPDRSRHCNSRVFRSTRSASCFSSGSGGGGFRTLGGGFGSSHVQKRKRKHVQRCKWEGKEDKPTE